MKEESILRATHEGPLSINGIEIKSYVLENGERVLSRAGLIKAIGRKGKAKGGRQFDEEFGMPVFLTANNLKPYIPTELVENSTAILFKDSKGKNSIGYRAQILPSICYVFLDALESGILLSNQVHIAERCKILVRGFATVGIIALVDEATGYQYERERDELQKILKAYISPELLPWQQKFPNDFYVHLFRLNGWDYTTNGIKNRPGVIGKWTKTLVYEQLPKGVLQELEKTTPKNDAGKYKAKLHQSLTDDIGNPHLAAQITQVVTLFKLSDSMAHMWSQFQKLRSVNESKGSGFVKSNTKETVEKKKEGGIQRSLFDFDENGYTIEPIDESTLSGFNRILKKALDFNPRE